MGILVSLLGFLPTIKPLIQTYWKQTGLVALVALFAYQNFSDTRFLFFMETIPSLERRLDVAKSNFDTCKAGNDTLTASIEKRNGEIAQWKELTGRLQHRNDELSGIIANNQQHTEAKVAEILEDATPQTCEAAIDYLRDGIGELTW